MIVTISMFNDLSASWMALIWKSSWQGGIALLLILCVSRASIRIPAYVLCWLWRLAFLKLLIAGIAIAPIELRWLPPIETASTNVPPTLIEGSLEPPREFLTEQISLPHLVASAAPAGLDRNTLAPQAAVSRLSGTSWLLIAWNIGLVLCCVNLVWHWVRVRKILSNLAYATDSALQQSVAENCRRIRANRLPELRISNQAGSPCLIGALWPVIVLPSAVLKACSTEALNAALLHELAHIKRRDLLWNWLPTLAEVLFFFHPLVWLARREWRLAQEIATDELALSVARVDGTRYAALMVELVANCRTTSVRPHLAIGVSESYSQLSRRMTAMLSFQERTMRHRIFSLTAVLVIAAGGIVPWKLTSREAWAQADSIVAPASATELQQASLLVIKKRGGTYYRNENRADQPVISVSFLGTSQATDADLKCLKDFPSLVDLNLHFPGLTDAGLESLKNLTNLKALSMTSSKVTNAGLEHLKALIGLEILVLENARIDDDGLAHLKRMTHLNMLHLSNTGITDQGLTHLRGMSKLHTLLLDGSRITDAGLEVVGKLISLRDLRLSETSISDRGLENLKELVDLQTLILNRTKVTGEGLAHLGELPNLQVLYLSDASVTDAGLEKVGSLSRLTKLALRKTRVADSGLEHLKGLTRLTFLDVVDTKITEAGLQALKAALPGCTIHGDPLKQQKVAVAQAKTEKNVDDLIEEFSNAEFVWMQADVARKLTALGDNAIIPRMKKLLDVADRGRRCNAALVLAGLGDKQGLTIIINELEDTKPRPTDLKKSDGSPDPESQIRQDRYYAALLLGQIGKKDAVPALIRATTDKSINYQAAISLGEIGDKIAIPALRQMAKDFPDQRLWAAYGLAALGEIEGFEVLEETALSNPQWIERRHAVEALEKISNPRTVAILRKALKDQEEHVRESALKALRTIGEKAPVENPAPPARNAPLPPGSAKASPTPETPAGRQTYQEIIAGRPAPDLTTLVARSSPNNDGPDASEAFMDILKLRETADPKSVPLLEKILAENLPTTRILGYAAAQALFSIGTPDAHQILSRQLLVDGTHTRLAIDYTSHWEMKEPLRSRFMERYLLKNLSKSLVVEVEQVASPNPMKGALNLVVILRNASDQPFLIFEDQGSDSVQVRDARGQFFVDTSGRICNIKRNATLVELKPGQSHRFPVTINVTDATESNEKRHDPSAQLIATVQQSGQRFEVRTPGRVEFVALVEAEPINAEQRAHLKIDDKQNWWSGRAVSKPLTVELALP